MDLLLIAPLAQDVLLPWCRVFPLQQLRIGDWICTDNRRLKSSWRRFRWRDPQTFDWAKDRRNGSITKQQSNGGENNKIDKYLVDRETNEIDQSDNVDNY